MRILVTGATGFVGRWLTRELRESGHDVVGAPSRRELDITDASVLVGFIARVRPEAVAHLAGVSHARDAQADPGRSLAVNEGGTRTLLEAVATVGRPPVIVTGSSEVYGRPAPSDLPLRETAPASPDQPYGQSKLAQERAALELGARHGLPLVVTRSFNHTGPGQRPEFVVPALAMRLIQARRKGLKEIPVGNLDVRRDLADVRDVVRAYRLLLEGLASGTIPAGTVVNVATGNAVSIRDVFTQLASLVGVEAMPRPDPALARANDPPLIVGDPRKLRELTGWAPAIPLTTTLSDVVVSMLEA